MKKHIGNRSKLFALSGTPNSWPRNEIQTTWPWLRLLYLLPAILFCLNSLTPNFCFAQDSIPPISFNQLIRPILNRHCTACHGGVQQAAGLSFVYRESVVAPEGWVVEPGDAEGSELIRRILSDDSDEVMPPPAHGSKLEPSEVELLRRWIDEGAQWQQHWALEVPQPQNLPPDARDHWSRQPIDRFILHRLQSEKLEPAADETDTRWLRRASLDLTGLPPTTELLETFLAEIQADPESAYQKAVDQLLASPHFGERWATVWLDQVRYADSKGLGLDGRRNIWKYRDWVISAFNEDLPFDQFTIKQMAGDLLPHRSATDLIATAAHRLSQSNEEGGTDDEEFRIAAVLDRVSTTWQTWQGLTYGCVQCHSHPYDPIEHDEFYKFAAFFNNTADCDLDQEWPLYQAPINPSDYPLAAQLDHQIENLRERIWQQEYSLLTDSSTWKPLVDLQATTNNATQVAIDHVDDHDEYHTVDTVSRNTSFQLEAPLPAGLQNLSAIRLTLMPLDPETAVADSEWGFVLSHLSAELLAPDQEPRDLPLQRLMIDEANPFIDPQRSLDPKDNYGFAAYTRIHYPRQAAIVLSESISIPPGSHLRVTLNHKIFILAAYSLIARRGHLAVTDDPRFTDLLKDQDYLAQQQELAGLVEKRQKIRSTSVPILAELPVHLRRPTHVFIRGLFLTKDKEVEPDVPAAFAPLPKDMPVDRLALAHWLVAADNPLTARVAVNRFWARIFGIGIVATEEDFGAAGEQPFHPQLLDDLAWRFQHQMNWSTKQLLRELVLSRTYRQSSKIRPELLESDPENRLLARGPRYRLSAETIRDQALAISGLLNPQLYGPPVYPPIPAGVWQPFEYGDKWQTAEPGNPNRYRRSIYTYTKRSIPYPIMATFDAPSRELCTPRRSQSNTPTQALMTLNDTTFDECAEGLAQLMKEMHPNDPRNQVIAGFVRATTRQPLPSEIDQLMTLYPDPSQGTAADLKAIATVLLNLDEVLTK